LNSFFNYILHELTQHLRTNKLHKLLHSTNLDHSCLQNCVSPGLLGHSFYSLPKHVLFCSYNLVTYAPSRLFITVCFTPAYPWAIHQSTQGIPAKLFLAPTVCLRCYHIQF